MRWRRSVSCLTAVWHSRSTSWLQHDPATTTLRPSATYVIYWAENLHWHWLAVSYWLEWITATRCCTALHRSIQQHPDTAASAEQCSQDRPPGSTTLSCQAITARPALAAQYNVAVLTFKSHTWPRSTVRLRASQSLVLIDWLIFTWHDHVTYI